MIYFFFYHLGTKIKWAFSENKCAVQLENIYSEIKICVYLELSFCWKTNITGPRKKRRSPLLTRFLLDGWCWLGKAASGMAIGMPTGGALFYQISLLRRKESSKFKEMHLKLVKHNCVWMSEYIIRKTKAVQLSWSHSSDMTPDLTAIGNITFEGYTKMEYDFSSS